jgi:hypothetical protein
MHVTFPAYGKQPRAESGGALVGKLGPASDPLDVPGIPGRPIRVPVQESEVKLSRGDVRCSQSQTIIQANKE